MMQARLGCFWAAMLLAAHTATAQTMPAADGPVRISIERSETRDDSELPYRRTNLTVQYDSIAPEAG
ncbi:MAG: hypothetical protein H8E53_02215, partial [Planctomycetes bacterium]|nr:hypothetical protein [Planctomycetota bacterium]